MGHGYKGGSETFRSISDNLGALKEKFPYHDGVFGGEGHGESKMVRHLESSDPLAQAHDFYDTAAFGGIEEELGNGKGFRTSMEDGTIFTIRDVSKSDGSPAVDISIRKSTDTGGVKQQKIHFIRRGHSK